VPPEPRPRCEQNNSNRPSILDDHYGRSCDFLKGISRAEVDLERKIKDLERKIDCFIKAYEGVLSRLILRIQILEHSRGGGGVFGKLRGYFRED
jgi:hypothetical protein